MARKRPHGSQFSSKNQPPAKKKQRKHEDYFEKVEKKSVAVQVCNFLSEEKNRSTQERVQEFEV